MHASPYPVVFLLAAVLVLPSCAPVIVAGAGTAAVAAHDRRTVGALIDDQTIELKVAGAVKSEDSLKQGTHVNVTSVNGIVLLSGEATTNEMLERVLAKAREVAGIRRIVNEVRIAPPSSFGSRAYDAWLTTKVKTRLIHTEDIDSTRVKVVTENDAVYLMGLVTRQEGDVATGAATQVGGVARVVKLFEYID